MATVWEWFDVALGLDDRPVQVAQVLVRCLVVYAATLAMIRLGDKRFIGKHTAFDVVLAVMLGSVASRAITDGTSVLQKLAAALALVMLHFGLSKLAFRWSWFGTLLKGSPRVLVRHGQVQREAMTKASITHDDLVGMLRTEASSSELERVDIAHLERSGDVSFIMEDPGPRVVDVDLEPGVKTVTIRIT